MGNCFSSKPSEKEKDFDTLGNMNYRKNISYNNHNNHRPSTNNILLFNNVNQNNSTNNNLMKQKYSRQNSSNFNGSESTTTTTTTANYNTEDQTSSNISRSTGSNSVSLSGTSSTNSNNFVNISKAKNAYVALYDYDARTNQDLSFKKGDILYINDDDKEPNGWWLAKFKTMNHMNKEVVSTGYIPSQYVAKYGSLESQPWYFGQTKRMEAEKLIMLDHNKNGSFLIRVSDGNNHAYSLSVRDHDSVKHYRIRLSEEGQFYITKRVPFNSLTELVDYYSKKPDGLWVQLMQPCIKVDVPITKGLTHSFMKDFEVDRKLFNLERKIGQGQFGDVWQGRFVFNKMKVAIKTLKEGMNPSDFKAEAALMKNISHPKLIQLYGLCTTEEPIYIITELMVNGSLLDYLQTPIGKRLQIDTLIYIASQIADGMAYLESRNYIHRDLAARNVLVGENNEVKVADFGLARVVKDMNNFYAAREGTKFPIKWTAPEAAIYNKFSVKSDVWSFGIVLTEIVTYGRTPYPSMSNQEVLQQVSHGYRMPKPLNCPDRLHQIMMSCWKQEAETRPTFETLKYKLEAFFEEDDHRQYRDTHNSNQSSSNIHNNIT
jgi:fyn-related kinase